MKPEAVQFPINRHHHHNRHATWVGAVEGENGKPGHDITIGPGLLARLQNSKLHEPRKIRNERRTKEGLT
jgi:hypothetical protein